MKKVKDAFLIFGSAIIVFLLLSHFLSLRMAIYWSAFFVYLAFGAIFLASASNKKVFIFYKYSTFVTFCLYLSWILSFFCHIEFFVYFRWSLFFSAIIFSINLFVSCLLNGVRNTAL